MLACRLIRRGFSDYSFAPSTALEEPPFPPNVKSENLPGFVNEAHSVRSICRHKLGHLKVAATGEVITPLLWARA